MSEKLWELTPDQKNNTSMTKFMKFVNSSLKRSFTSYGELYNFSVSEKEAFWELFFDYADIIHSQKSNKVLSGNTIRNARWFEGARLNFAENLLRFRGDRIAISYKNEQDATIHLSYNQLYKKVAGCIRSLRKIGIRPGDRVAAYINNRPEAIIDMLAASAIGAVWSSCSPDFGLQGVLDRFGQIKPKLLITNVTYQYNGKSFDNSETIKKIAEQIHTIEKIILIDNTNEHIKSDSGLYSNWNQFCMPNDDEIMFEQFPFDHPLYIMYSSGTTGKPKCIVHGAGGTLIQHLKELVLHTDLKPSDVITYFTTCGWMMWNWLVSSLAVGATVVLYDGSPGYPDLSSLFNLIDEEQITVFGTSPKFLSSCETAGVIPQNSHRLSSLRTILSTGAPLSTQNYAYVYNNIKSTVQLASISGGTDIISCFMLGNPILPVFSGELQCRGLGMDVKTFNDSGDEVINEVGELVCTSPFPSRPVYFWNDPEGILYDQAYFSHFKNVWRHGDYIKINDHGGVIVYGRSDATLNPGGVRIGTAEIYGPVEAIEEVDECIAIGIKEAGDTIIILFVKTANNIPLDEALQSKIRETLRTTRTPRHVPSQIHQVTDIPRTLNGKKVEMAVTKLIHGEEITNLDALANPESLDQYKLIANRSD